MAAKSGVDPAQAAELCRFVHVRRSACVFVASFLFVLVLPASVWRVLKTTIGLVVCQAECDNLILAGLMCIGKYGEDSSDDFKVRCTMIPRSDAHSRHCGRNDLIQGGGAPLAALV